VGARTCDVLIVFVEMTKIISLLSCGEL
jgi:hypothetical protein